MEKKKVSAVVLAGGNSKRMGQNKALLKFGNKTMIEIIVDSLKTIFDEIIVVTNTPEEYFMLEDVKFALDRIQTGEKSSLVGLYTGLWEAKNDYIFVIACDMPLLNLDLIAYMVEGLRDEDVLIPYLEGHHEPLYAIYGKKCLEPMKVLLETENYAILKVFHEVVVKKIGEDEVRRFDPSLQSFLNVNTYEDYLHLTKRAFNKEK